jgi:membrane fusion protein, multidrug efflux system
MRMTLSRSLALVAAVSTTTLAGCAPSNAEPPVRGQEPAAVVRAAPIVDTVLARPIVAAGTVAPADEAALGFKIGGVIQRIAVDEGDPVRAGQTLAVLDLREIDAGLAKARSGADKSARDLARMRRLYRDSVVTLAQLQDAETADEMARADLEAAAVNRRYAVIVAPATGVVLRRSAEPGENIAAGAPVLVVGTRGGAKANVVEIGLADRDAVSVERGDPAVARFDALPGRAFRGRVTRIGAAADPTTGTYQVEVTLDEGGALAAGLVGTVEIRPKRGTPTALVPIESVLEADGGEATVYALSSDGARALRRRVTVAFIDGSRVAISDGLDGASRVLTDGAAYLDDGAAVRVAP